VLVLEWRAFSLRALRLAFGFGLGADGAGLAAHLRNKKESSDDVLGPLGVLGLVPGAAAVRAGVNATATPELHAELYLDTLLYQWGKRRLLSLVTGECRSGWDS
jgi:hypothetical protein